jgi:hypothetical protein
MSSGSVILFCRIVGPLVASGLAYAFWHYINNRQRSEQRQDALLVVTYISSRLGLWLLFALYMQDYVTSSDPRLYYTPMLERFLAGEVPIRDFFYPYGPLLIPSMLPLYLLLGHTLAGISLFAVAAEAVALFFFLKCTSLLEKRGELDRSWVREALAVYLLNPATLYWTVFQGYHSIVQTAYSMAAFYLLLCDYPKTGYAVGLYSIAGSKFLAILDWPALLGVCRPRLTKLFLGAVPLLLTYVAFQMITGDVLFPLRYHAGFLYEGNVWYLLTVFGDLLSFYAAFPGNLLPLFFFGMVFLLGLVHWLRCLRLGLTSFSFQAAIGTTTFTMSLFFLFTFYTGDYYIPMLMLPACLVVTCPALPHRHGVWLLLLISGFSVAGDAVWTSLGQPLVLLDVLWSGSFSERLLTSFWIGSILVRIASFAMLARWALRVAITSSLVHENRLSVPVSQKDAIPIGTPNVTV